MKYTVSIFNFNESGEFYPINFEEYDSPKAAIKAWFVHSKKYPTCTAIDSNLENANKLLKWANDNPDKLEKWHEKYNCPYKLEYMQEGIKKGIELERPSGFIRLEGYTDSIHPFTMG